MILLPMLNVKEVDREIAWFESIGFVVANAYIAHSGALAGKRVWAILAHGNARLMIAYSGTVEAARERRDADLYVLTDDLGGAMEAVREKGEVVQEQKRRPYGMTEFTVRSPGGFWLTFGCPDPE